MMTPEKVRLHYDGPFLRTGGPNYFTWQWVAKSMLDPRACWELHFVPQTRRFSLYKGYTQKSDGLGRRDITGLCRVSDPLALDTFRDCLPVEAITLATAAAIAAPAIDVSFEELFGLRRAPSSRSNPAPMPPRRP